MSTLATWLLLTISYHHEVRTAVYATEALCEEAKAQPMVDIQDKLCVPIPGRKS